MIQRNSSPASAPRSQASAEVASHTPTPWHCDDTAIFAEGGVLARIPNHPDNGKNWAEDAALIVKVVNGRQALLARIARLEADLLECREYLEGFFDVIDGDYGEPMPNRAMALVTMIDESLNGRPY